MDTQNTAEQSSSMTYIIGLIIVIALGAGLWWYFVGSDTDTQTTDIPAVAENYPDVVARVNGEEVNKEVFVASLTQVMQTAQAQGLDSSDSAVSEQIEAQALDTSINTILLTQAANEAGVTATDQQINEQIASLETQFGGTEGLQAQLVSAGVSTEKLRADIRQQIIINAYIEQNTDVAGIEVTDEEVDTFYASLLGGAGGELPPLEADVREQLRQQLVIQKQQELVADLIASLRAEADIEVLI